MSGKDRWLRKGSSARDTGKEIVKVLDRQRLHYVAMRDVVDRQTAHIRAMDIGRLAAGASEVRGLMRKIRDLETEFRPLRQTWGAKAVSRPASEQEAIEALVGEIKGLIGDIQVSRDGNAALLNEKMTGLKAQMAGLQTQSSVARAYGDGGRRAASRVPPARFIDRSN